MINILPRRIYPNNFRYSIWLGSFYSNSEKTQIVQFYKINSSFLDCCHGDFFFTIFFICCHGITSVQFPSLTFRTNNSAMSSHIMTLGLLRELQSCEESLHQTFATESLWEFLQVWNHFLIIPHATENTPQSRDPKSLNPLQSLPPKQHTLRREVWVPCQNLMTMVF